MIFSKTICPLCGDKLNKNDDISFYWCVKSEPMRNFYDNGIDNRPHYSVSFNQYCTLSRLTIKDFIIKNVSDADGLDYTCIGSNTPYDGPSREILRLPLLRGNFYNNPKKLRDKIALLVLFS